LVHIYCLQTEDLPLPVLEPNHLTFGKIIKDIPLVNRSMNHEMSLLHW